MDNVKEFEVITYVAKTKHNSKLSVFEDAETMGDFLTVNEDFAHSIEWIKPIISKVKAPGVADATKEEERK
jgi:hypothetical protein